MTLPRLDDVANIVVDNLPCDGLVGTVIKVATAVAQGPLALATIRRQLSAKFKQAAGVDFKQYGEAVRDELKKTLDSANGDPFERWLAEFDQDNFFANIFDPFSPGETPQPIHNDSFSLFGADALADGGISTGSVGSGVEFDNHTCDGAISGQLAGAASFSLADSRRMQREFSAAGKVMGLSAYLAANPNTLLDILLQTAMDTSALFTQLLTANTAIKTAAQLAYDAARSIPDEDYSKQLDVLTFVNLLDNVALSAKKASDKINAGGSSGSSHLDDDVRAGLARASGWIRSSSGLESFYATQSLVVGQLLLIETQVSLLTSLAGKGTARLSNISKSFGKLSVSAEQPVPKAYFTNIFTTVHCKARKIRDEVLAINQQKTQDFFVKRMQWAVTLQSLRLMVDRFSSTTYAAGLQSSVQSAAGTALSQFTTTLDVSWLEDLEKTVEDLQNAVEAFNKQVKGCLRTKAAKAALQVRYDQLIQAIASCDAQTRKLTSVLDSLLGNSAVKVAQTSALVFLTATAAVKALVPIVESLRSGDYETAFSKDALNDSLDNMLSKLLAKAQECCESSGATDSQSRSGLVRLQTLQRASADENRRSGLDTVFFDDVGADTNRASKFDARQLKADLRELTRLLRIPCLGGISEALPLVI